MANSYQRGLYWVKCTHQSFGEKGEKGTPCLTLDIAIVGMVNNADRDGDLVSVPAGNRRIDIYLTDATMEFAAEQLQHIGFDKSSLRFLDPAVEGYFNFVERDFEAFCKLEAYKGEDTKYKGREFEKWSISIPREREPVKPVEKSKLSKLDILFGAEVKKKTKDKLNGRKVVSNDKAPANEPVGATSGPPTDDIPF